MSVFLSCNALLCRLVEALQGVALNQLLFSLTPILLKRCKKTQNSWESLTSLFSFFYPDHSSCEKWIFPKWMGDEYKSMLSITESRLKESKILFWCYSLNSTLVHLLIEKVMKMEHSYLFPLKRVQHSI